MKPSLLFLAVRMQRGFGVSVVIDNLSKHLEKKGISVHVGCLEQDEFFAHLNIHQVSPIAEAIANLAKQLSCSVIIAHTTPYFEVLPSLASQFRCWAWEHGDPNPEFFFADRREREQIILHKKTAVYPKLEKIIAISEFIKSEIEVPNAHIIYNGCDHVPDQGVKQPIDNPSCLNIGALMRLGSGEALYKGALLVLELNATLRKLNIPVDFHLMGRGEKSDAKPFLDAGFEVHLNASDEERAKYLRDIDVFISTSLWEGFNLPLIEAQASGTAALAFDTGAHPEVTPLVCRNINDMAALIEQYNRDNHLLYSHSRLCYEYVRNKFSWERSVDSFLEVLG